MKVQWLNLNPKAIARGYWDQGLIEDIFSGAVWAPIGMPDEIVHEEVTGLDGLDADGAIVVLPARHNAQLARVICDRIGRMRWAIVILTGDEEHTFDTSAFPPHVVVWTMHPGRNARADVPIGSGYPPPARKIMAEGLPNKTLGWFFAGQDTHSRRHECFAVLDHTPNGLAQPTPGFTQGEPLEDYLRHLTTAKVAPCPSGPVCVDSFRLYEALEAACIPIVDNATPAGPTPWYWRQVHPDAPFPAVDHWSEAPAIIEGLLADWPHNANQVFAWWQLEKRTLAYRLWRDARRLHGEPLDPNAPDHLGGRITVIITTSPAPLHPDTAHLDETVESVRERLPDADIIISCDGVHPSQAHYADAYGEYVRRLTWKANTEWSNVLPVVLAEHGHQANGLRAALAHTRTPNILFMEHDTPLVGPQVPWDDLCDVIDDDDANMIRLHHEASVLEPHRHLMLDETPTRPDGVPLLRTAQWSQRPHLASTAWYRWLLRTYFAPESRTMIEDVMHGVLTQAYRTTGLHGWNSWKVWLYAPEGDIKRSWHLDSRGDDDKVEMVFAYPDNITPTGAPRSTKDRIELDLH